jgi:hypothetical protein
VHSFELARAAHRADRECDDHEQADAAEQPNWVQTRLRKIIGCAGRLKAMTHLRISTKYLPAVRSEWPAWVLAACEAGYDCTY